VFCTVNKELCFYIKHGIFVNITLIAYLHTIYSVFNIKGILIVMFNFELRCICTTCKYMYIDITLMSQYYIILNHQTSVVTILYHSEPPNECCHNIISF
jgi:hypothetical protein